jgi:hypothetical protein
MSQTKHDDVKVLFQSARADGVLSDAAMAALTVVDLGAQIQAGLGISVDDVPASEVVLVTLMPDDSGSIQGAGNADLVRDGHNLVLDALLASKQRDGVLFHTRFLNGSVLNPFRPVDQAVRLDGTNYDPALGTPLYDQTVVLLGTVLAKAQQFAESGVMARSVTLLITDGADQHSQRASAGTVKGLVKDLCATGTHIVAGMGIADGHTDFRRVFQQMGIPDEWILTPGNSTSEIRKAFQMFSQSAVRASQGAGSFGKTALGGFGR